MLVVDAQVHVWTEGEGPGSWPSERRYQPHRAPTPSYLPEELLEDMAEAGVEQAILVPLSTDRESNNHCVQSANAILERFRVLARLSPVDTDRGLLDEYWSQPSCVGVRISFARGRVQHLIDGSAEWIWRTAERVDIPVFVHVDGLVGHVEPIAKMHPDLRIVVDHLGVPTAARDSEVDHYVDALVELSAFENIAVKASCLPSMTSDRYPFPSLRPKMERVIESFGVDRVFWGSDLTRLPCSYVESVTHMNSLRDFLSADELGQVMGEGIKAWVSW